MKLKNRIFAAFTAFIMMFTLTDYSLLAEFVGISGKAFSAETISSIILKNDLPNPVAGEKVWDSKAVVLDQYANDITVVSVDWYKGSDTMGIPVTETFKYNSTHTAVIKFQSTQAGKYVFSESLKLQFDAGNKFQELTAKYETELDADRINLTVTVYFEKLTDRPDATKVYFKPIQYVVLDEVTDYYPADNFPCHTKEQEILNALPSKAVVYTQSEDIYFEAPINWINERSKLDIIAGDIYNSTVVTKQEFTILGTVKIPKENAPSVANADCVFTDLKAHIVVDAADKLSKPTADPESGTSRKENFTVKLTQKNATEIWYTRSESPNGPDPIVGTETETNFKYKSGIAIAGAVGRTKTWYIKAIAHNPLLQDSEMATFVYTVTLKPTEFTNIPEIWLEVDDPVGGKVFDTEVTVPNNAPELQKNGVAFYSKVDWIRQSTGVGMTTGIADYYERYTMTVSATPNNMYAFFHTPKVYVNGNLATSSTKEDGTLTITYTFPNKTEKLPLVGVQLVDNKKIYVENGTSAEDILKQYLPSVAQVEAPKGTLLDQTYPIKWDMTTAVLADDPTTHYDPKKGDEQELTVTGVVLLPDFISYKPEEKKHLITATVVVGAAGQITWPTASPPDSQENGGTVFYSDTTVTLSVVYQDSTVKNATIYYTKSMDVDPPDPTVSGGTKYISPILLEGIPGKKVTYYIKAIATAPGKTTSQVNSFIYIINMAKQEVALPTASLKEGTYTEPINVTLNTSTYGAKIRYTIDPAATRDQFVDYENAIRLEGIVDGSKTYEIRCYAYYPNDALAATETVKFKYTVTRPKNSVSVPEPSIDPGTYDKSLDIKLTCSTPKTEVYYTINGKNPKEKDSDAILATGKVIRLEKELGEAKVYTIKAYSKSLDPNLIDSKVVTFIYYVGIDYGVEKIEIVTRPLKYSYYYGESINVSGGKIKVTYVEKGKTEIIHMDEGMIIGFDSWTYGQQSVEVYYKGKTAYFNVVIRKSSYDDDDDDGNNSGGNKDDNKDDGKDTNKDSEKDNNKDNDSSDTSDQTLPTMEGSGVKGWTQLQKKIAALDTGGRAIIYLNGETSVPASFVNAAAKKKLALEFVIDKHLRWVLDTGTLSKTVASVSVGVNSKSVYIPAVLIDGEGGDEIIRVHTYGDNKVGSVLYVNTGINKKNKFVNLYRYDEDKRCLVFTDASKVSEKNGVAQVVTKSSGDYVVMMDTRTKLPGDVNNNCHLDLTDAAMIVSAVAYEIETDYTWDFNGDGKVDTKDAAAILKVTVGLA